MATISEVARHAGVSTATVSRVVNSPEVVNAETRDTVRASIAALNFRPNNAARTLKRRSSQTVGVVVNRFSSPYFGAIIDGIEQALRDVGYKTIAEASHETGEGQLSAWLSLVSRQCESFVVHADALDHDTLVAQMTAHPTTVLINRLLPGFEDRCVRLDNYAAGRMAAEFLIAQGHRHLATVTGPIHVPEIASRHAGFAAAVQEHGLDLPSERVVFGRFTEDGAAAATKLLWQNQQPLTAIFYHNDIMAAGGIAACDAMNVQVPDDLSVMGFDDLVFARHMAPKLTTVRQPMLDIGAAAGALAHALAIKKDDTSDIQSVFEAELIVRASVKTISSTK